MLAYRQGDAGAFATLYARHKGPLYRFVLRSVKDRALAEELYQEIWMRVIEARGRYAVQAKFTTWLYTIAHHRITDHWRKRGLQSVDAEEADAVAHRSFEPEPRAEGRQDLQRLAAALAAESARAAGAGAISLIGCGGTCFFRYRATPITPTSSGRPVRAA